MAYRLARHDASMQAALRRIAGDQVASAIAAIDDPALAPAEAIHTVRKACKKVRGLLRLVRPAFDGYRDENDAFRDIARGLSGLRDADILAATGAALAARDPQALGHAALARFQRRRAAARAADAGATGDPRRRLARSRNGLVDAAGRCARWTLDVDGFAALRGGLRRSYAQARTAMRDAQASPDDDAFHDWRKRAKDHWYHARLLQPVWPGPMRAHARCAGALCDALGEHHDLAVFRQAVARLGDAGPDPVGARLAELARARQAALATEAVAIGTRLLAPRPKALSRHWRACFRAWRSDR